MSYKLGFSNYAYFYLAHQKKGIKLIPEPIKWDEGSSSQKRDKDTRTNEITISSEYEYYGVSKDYILDIIYKLGVNEDVYLYYYAKESNGKKSLKFSALLDLSSYSIEKSKLKLKFDKSSLRKVLKANQDKKIELERTTSLSGLPISNLTYETLNIESRGLFLKSSMYTDTSYYFGIENRRTTSGGRTIQTTVAFPLKIKNNAHPDNLQETAKFTNGYLVKSTSGDGQHDDSLNDSTFFTETQEDRTLDLSLVLSIDLSNDDYVYYDSDEIYIILGKHNASDSTINDYVSQDVLVGKYYPNPRYRDTINVNIIKTVKLNKGESLSLYIRFKSNLGTRLGGNEWSRTSFQMRESSVVITERNKTKDQKRRVFGVYELGQRLIELITGNKNLFHSRALSTGEFKDLKFTSGLYIRGFYGANYVLPGKEINTNEDINDTKRIQIALKDYVDYLKKLAIVHSFKKIDGIEKICFEKVGEQYLKREFIRLKKQGFNFKKSFSKDDVFSSIKIGSKFADVKDNQAIYKDIYGLTEYNSLTEWSTEHTKIKNEFSIITNFREDPTGVTLALKKSIETNTSEDTSFDSSIFALDCVTTKNGLTKLRKWADDFLKAPKNIYDPTSAYNLRLTPRSVLDRWMFLISTMLTKDLSMVNATGNSSLKLTHKDGKITQENENIKPQGTFLSGEVVSFDYPYSLEDSNLISGQTDINNITYSNTQGFIRFKDENGNIRIGWAKSIKEGDKIEFEINTAK